MNEYYQILELPIGSNLEAIKKAFRHLSKKFHPDKYPPENHSEDERKKITERFQKISSAYDYLIKNVSDIKASSGTQTKSKREEAQKARFTPNLKPQQEFQYETYCEKQPEYNGFPEPPAERFYGSFIVSEQGAKFIERDRNAHEAEFNFEISGDRFREADISWTQSNPPLINISNKLRFICHDKFDFKVNAEREDIDELLRGIRYYQNIREICEIGIDEYSELYIVSGHEYDHFSNSWNVKWNASNNSYYLSKQIEKTGTPKIAWFYTLLTGAGLYIGNNTRWFNISDKLKNQMEQFARPDGTLFEEE
jgi:curved DNA-binding protein CbpA